MCIPSKLEVLNSSGHERTSWADRTFERRSKLLASEPNSQELSRLTYHLSNKPSKLNHIASEVTSKADTDARKAGSNARSKACVPGHLQRRRHDATRLQF